MRAPPSHPWFFLVTLCINWFIRGIRGIRGTRLIAPRCNVFSRALEAESSAFDEVKGEKMNFQIIGDFVYRTWQQGVPDLREIR